MKTPQSVKQPAIELGKVSVQTKGQGVLGIDNSTARRDFMPGILTN
ncbi:hypothetical protein [Qipengyuania qiaonensis]|uniref:Uncharacterized protein n=1 Tax=Qipengyuania qiaonensis TaxID=2867240 RepID=A0ABS7J2Y0_9SPHN|nr:hypothetical protein [Qipengyuania qiaonensis]MBX7481676.1 hypothetical protein [Qipengyuania qiaonensis]